MAKNGFRSTHAVVTSNSQSEIFSDREVNAVLAMTNKLLSGDTEAAQNIARSAPGRSALGKFARMKRGTTELEETA